MAKLSCRAIQRIEKGEGANPHSKRALARAFELEDIDVFNKYVHIPDEKSLKEGFEHKQEETITLVLEKIVSGKMLREMTEEAGAYSFGFLVSLTNDCERVFAELQDYIKDYSDIHKEFSAVQRLDINEELEKILSQFEKNGFHLGIAVGKIMIGQESNLTTLKINHYVVDEKGKLPRQIVVSKSFEL